MTGSTNSDADHPSPATFANLPFESDNSGHDTTQGHIPIKDSRPISRTTESSVAPETHKLREGRVDGTFGSVLTSSTVGRSASKGLMLCTRQDGVRHRDRRSPLLAARGCGRTLRRRHRPALALDEPWGALHRPYLAFQPPTRTNGGQHDSDQPA